MQLLCVFVMCLANLVIPAASIPLSPNDGPRYTAVDFEPASEDGWTVHLEHQYHQVLDVHGTGKENCTSILTAFGNPYMRAVLVSKVHEIELYMWSPTLGCLGTPMAKGNGGAQFDLDPNVFAWGLRIV